MHFDQFLTTLVAAYFLAASLNSVEAATLQADVEVGPVHLDVERTAQARSLQPQPWLKALISKESSGNCLMVGDPDRVNHAYGPLQIRLTVIKDVNKRFGWHYTPEQCLGDLNLSIKIFCAYESIWATEEKIGRPVQIQDMVRIWNGGPRGFEHDSTLAYWEDVRRRYQKISKMCAMTKTPSLAASE